MRRYAIPTALVVAIVAAGVGWFAPDDDYFALRKNFTLFARMYEELAAGYADPVDPERLMRTGIDAMLESLDPYTVFLDEADSEDMEIMSRGRYGGVGIAVGERAGRLVVTAVLDGSTAFEQGLRPGDIVARVAGRDAAGLAPEDLRSLLRGSPGTTLDLEIEREGEPAPLRFALARREVRLHDVTYSGLVGAPAQRVGYIRLERFSEQAAPEVREAIERLTAEAGGSGLAALVLDLRGNPGGLLEAAVDVSGLFLPRNTPIVSTRGRAAETERAYRSRVDPIAADLPLAILVDRRSASASEIVAGALQDHDRALIVGERSFGKGLVQTIRPLPYHTAIKLTTSRYYIPSGRSIQAVVYGDGGEPAPVPDSLRRTFRTTAGRPVRDGGGIEPDVPVTLGPEGELEAALDRSAAFFLFANRFRAEHDDLPAGFSVDDELLAEFRAWVESQGSLRYRTRAERMLEDLAEDLDGAGYAAADDEVAALRAEVAREKAGDFRRHEARLRVRLRDEILSRYVGRAEADRVALADDPQLDAALAGVGDPARYRRTLRPR